MLTIAGATGVGDNSHQSGNGESEGRTYATAWNVTSGCPMADLSSGGAPRTGRVANPHGVALSRDGHLALQLLDRCPL